MYLRVAALFVAVSSVMAVPASAADPAHTPEIACRVLLSPQAIPGDPGFRISMQQVTVPAGHDGHKHDHPFVEYLQVIRGSGTLSVTGKPDASLAPGTVIAIPTRVVHQAHNGSNTEPLVFTATFLERSSAQTVTEYVGEPDKAHGCPHHQK